MLACETPQASAQLSSHMSAALAGLSALSSMDATAPATRRRAPSHPVARPLHPMDVRTPQRPAMSSRVVAASDPRPRTRRRAPSHGPARVPQHLQGHLPGMDLPPTPAHEAMAPLHEDVPPVVARSMTEHGGSYMPQSCPPQAIDSMSQSLRTQSTLATMTRDMATMQLDNSNSGGRGRAQSVTALTMLSQSPHAPPRQVRSRMVSPELGRRNLPPVPRFVDPYETNHIIEEDDNALFQMDM
ncbi:MAG: hypothetical protein MHM6MM_003567 [Cercozoa sp. M6MM]